MQRVSVVLRSALVLLTFVVTGSICDTRDTYNPYHDLLSADQVDEALTALAVEGSAISRIDSLLWNDFNVTEFDTEITDVEESSNENSVVEFFRSGFEKLAGSLRPRERMLISLNPWARNVRSNTERSQRTIPPKRSPVHRKQIDPLDMKAIAPSTVSGKQQIVFGIGTGRCGTLGLSKLLKYQPGSFITDESRKWGKESADGCIVWSPLGGQEEIEKVAQERIDYLKKIKRSLVGDVWSAHLPYVEGYIKAEPTTKVVVLERDREAVIQSFKKKTEGRNHWQTWTQSADWKADNNWDCAFPKFDDAESKGDAIGLYWDLYKETTDRLIEKYPNNIRKYSTDELLDNKDDTQRKMLEWLTLAHPRTKKSHENSVKQRRRAAPHTYPSSRAQQYSYPPPKTLVQKQTQLHAPATEWAERLSVGPTPNREPRERLSVGPTPFRTAYGRRGGPRPSSEALQEMNSVEGWRAPRSPRSPGSHRGMPSWHTEGGHPHRIKRQG